MIRNDLVLALTKAGPLYCEFLQERQAGRYELLIYDRPGQPAVRPVGSTSGRILIWQGCVIPVVSKGAPGCEANEAERMKWELRYQFGGYPEALQALFDTAPLSELHSR